MVFTPSYCPKQSADHIHTDDKYRDVKGMFAVVTEREVHSYIKMDQGREVNVTNKGSESVLYCWES